MHSPEFIEQVKSQGTIEDVASDFMILNKKGSALTGDCPMCGSKQKFSVSPAKKVFKCWSCEVGGNDTVDFLTRTQDYTFPNAIKYLADKYNLTDHTIEEKPGKNTKAKNHKFRDLQLLESGIPEKSQKYWLKSGQDTLIEMDRYQSGTIDKHWNVLPGDDMILHYLDLDSSPLMYYPEGNSKARALIRVRWSNPSLHLSKEGNQIKYQSPSKSGSHLWLPQYILELYTKGLEFETLYLTEGEKKADKMCIHKMPTVGIQGIHNFSNTSEMPHQLQMIVKKCKVKNIVLIFDSDWQSISIKPNKPVDQRPNNFFRAALRYRDYFYAYTNEGIFLNIYMAAGKETAYKGVDDLLTRHSELKGKEDALAEDFRFAMVDRDGKGEYMQVYKITTESEYKLKEYWNIHSKSAFFDAHRSALKTLPEFTYRTTKYRVNDEGEFEQVQALLPNEKYWNLVERTTRSGEKYEIINYNYVNARIFLRNRRFGRYMNGITEQCLVHVDSKVVREINHGYVQDYVLNYTEEIEERGVLNMLLAGIKQYMGPDALSRMYPVTLQFIEPEKEAQYLFFKKTYWKITADNIIERPITDLPSYVWYDKIIDFEAKLEKKPIISIDRVNDRWLIKETKEIEECEMYAFFKATSNFNWRKDSQVVTDEEGVKVVVPKADKDREKWSEEDLQNMCTHIVCKMLATGYLLHSYRDFATTKAVVCMDGIESEVGSSEGGTGKSLFAKMFEYLVPTFYVDAKKKNLEDDNHLYEGVNDRTQIIWLDDCLVNLNFESFFSQITRGVTVNPKGQKRYVVNGVKFIFCTNHSFNGMGNSHKRRQYLLAFSDFFNGINTPMDVFGHQLFQEWDQKQWNSFYNFMAICIQSYLKHGLRYSIPEEDLERRKLRQFMGEEFRDWAELTFDSEGRWINCKVEKFVMYSDFIAKYPNERRYTTMRKFKDKLKIFCKYMKYEFNPLAGQDGRLKSGTKEYFLITNSLFDANKDAKLIESLEID